MKLNTLNWIFEFPLHNFKDQEGIFCCFKDKWGVAKKDLRNKTRPMFILGTLRMSICEWMLTICDSTLLRVIEPILETGVLLATPWIHVPSKEGEANSEPASPAVADRGWHTLTLRLAKTFDIKGKNLTNSKTRSRLDLSIYLCAQKALHLRRALTKPIIQGVRLMAPQEIVGAVSVDAIVYLVVLALCALDQFCGAMSYGTVAWIRLFIRLCWRCEHSINSVAL
ncbi:hypothetical protein J6590_100343 [Homalodisca vitripennis]|nr:hypothetical protein J6590_100343 [Homalodisca vitripennis]